MIPSSTGNVAGELSIQYPTQTVKHADDLVVTGKNAVKTFPKANSATLGKNLEKAGIPKPTSTSQAHHDLPGKFQDKFNAAGIDDINAAEYGRWVEGSVRRSQLPPGQTRNVGTHQNWSQTFEKEWEAFFDAHKLAGTIPTKDQILTKMYDLRANPKFASNL